MVQSDPYNSALVSETCPNAVEGGDHCSENTLKQLPASVPIFIYDPPAMKQVKGWNHFDTAIQTPKFDGNWRKGSVPPLPEDISISMLHNSKDWSNLHFGLVVAFQTPQMDGANRNDGSNNVECIYHTPHGTPVAHLEPLVTADPPVQVLSLLHGRLRVDVGWWWANFTANSKYYVRSCPSMC